jgi:hypothetical protein
MSNVIHNILVSRFENQSILTRKKSLPMLSLSYEYDNIFDREFRQIENFVLDVNEALDSFSVVDFSKGVKPSGITDGGGGNTWVVAISETRLFSTITNEKSDWAFVWDGSNWVLADITAITTNTSITLNVSGTAEYGALTLVNANLYGYVYPVYTCYLAAGAMSDFKPTVYIDDSLTLVGDGGWCLSGTISFVSKYRV